MREETIRLALENLIRSRDTLGLQLTHVLAYRRPDNSSDILALTQLEEELALPHTTETDEQLAERALELAILIGPRLNTETLSVLLNIDIDRASKVLLLWRSHVAV